MNTVVKVKVSKQSEKLSELGNLTSPALHFGDGALVVRGPSDTAHHWSFSQERRNQAPPATNLQTATAQFSFSSLDLRLRSIFFFFLFMPCLAVVSPCLTAFGDSLLNPCVSDRGLSNALSLVHGAKYPFNGKIKSSGPESDSV